ncbi:MAG TPA: 4-carboxymuconolactone decarboxylase [Jatrophihabitans sp.]|nr:4-carboxymuconolactone decarboxylase [Jatrophihabitans sp.]
MIELACAEAGRPDGPPLVLLNSIGSSAAMWTPCLAPLAERFRLLLIDHPGHGGSPSASRPLTVADLGRGVLAVLDRLAVGRADLAGLSLGGMTGIWLAAHAPDRIGRLALLCTTAAPAHRDAYRDRAAAVRAGGMPAVVEQVLPLWITRRLADRDPELRDRLAAMLTAVDPESYARCCELLAELDLRADLARIAAPTLVLAGEQDPATPPSHAEAIVAGVAGARLELLSPAAHLATVEQPGRIARLLLEHFQLPGDTVRRAVLGDAHVDRAAAATDAFSRPFQDFITRYAWGEIWGRPGLSRRDRSIATLAVLAALGAEHELALHVRGARTNGLTDAEIAEVLLHTAVYAGVPRANRATAIARETLAELDRTASGPTTEEDA